MHHLPYEEIVRMGLRGRDATYPSVSDQAHAAAGALSVIKV